MPKSQKPVSFANIEAFRRWLAKHHASEAELILRCWKTANAHRGVTYREALDEALCWGWIDGIRRAVDASSFSQRFSPRKSSSEWSHVNLRRYKELLKDGRIRPPGAAAFARRTEAKHSYANRPAALSREFLARFRANPRAWRYFQSRPPGYQRLCAFFVMSAKQAETRNRRFVVVLDCCAAEKLIPGMDRIPRPG